MERNANERIDPHVPLAQRLRSAKPVRLLRSASAGLANVSRLSCSESPRACGPTRHAGCRD